MSQILNQFKNGYERRAHVYAMALALVPVWLATVCYVSHERLSLKAIPATVIFLALVTFLARLAREAGKAKEPVLLKAWGGWPSVHILRYSDARIDPISKRLVHEAMARVVPGTKALTAAGEASDPELADQYYTAWSEYLRKAARHAPAQFPHVADANANYGLYRNLWGLKPYALMLTIAAFVLSGTHAAIAFLSYQPLPLSDLATAAVLMVWAILWIFVVNKGFVKSAADTYAHRLIDDCIPEVPSPRKRPNKKKTAVNT